MKSILCTPLIVLGILNLILKIGKKSEAFRKAHSGGGQHQGIYLGHPEFEGFEVIL